MTVEYFLEIDDDEDVEFVPFRFICGLSGSPELYLWLGIICELEESEKNLCDELFFEEVLDSPEECFCFAAS